jgi:hypothetical protein
MGKVGVARHKGGASLVAHNPGIGSAGRITIDALHSGPLGAHIGGIGAAIPGPEIPDFRPGDGKWNVAPVRIASIQPGHRTVKARCFRGEECHQPSRQNAVQLTKVKLVPVMGREAIIKIKIGEQRIELGPWRWPGAQEQILRRGLPE